MKYLIGGRASMEYSPATNLNVVRRGETSFIAFGVWMSRVGASRVTCQINKTQPRNEFNCDRCRPIFWGFFY